MSFLGGGGVIRRIIDPTLDLATIAWRNAVIANGGTVSDARLVIVNTLIVGLRTDNLFTKMDRLWLFAGENQPSALTDIIATDLASAVSSPTFTIDRGFAGNGTTSYIDTTFNAFAQGITYTQTAAHYSLWDNTNRAANFNVEMGAKDAGWGADASIYYAAFGYGVFRLNANSFPTATNTSSNGHFIVSRDTDTTFQVYQNSNSIGSATGTDNNPASNFTVFVGGRNDNGVFSAGTTDQFSMCSFGGTLSANDSLNFYNRMRTYMTAVGVP